MDSLHYVMENHPCYINGHSSYGRIHLPVASECNMKCNYCDQKIGGRYHAFRPSVATRIISPDEALELVRKYAYNERLRVVGIAGPGEPLYNADTFKTLEKIKAAFPELIFCLSTNGLLLEEYAEMLKQRMLKHKSQCWLVNTGWVGGRFGVGKRISIRHTRNLLNAALEGKLEKVKYRKDKLFGFEVPLSCPDVPEDVLEPSTSWGDKDEYWKKYDALAARFIENFKLFASGCSQEVVDAGPKRYAKR